MSNDRHDDIQTGWRTSQQRGDATIGSISGSVGEWCESDIQPPSGSQSTDTKTGLRVEQEELQLVKARGVGAFKL